MSDTSPQITFVLFTFNEERRIDHAVRNFKAYGRVLIVDNESVDRTRDIARDHGCDILIHKNAGWVEDETTAARVKQTVVTPWIYWGFADEAVDAATMTAILAAVHSKTCDVVSILRKNYYYGEFCHDLFATRTNRIFRKYAIDFTGNTIHNFGRVVDGARIYNLPSTQFVHHFISNTAGSYLDALNRYTEVESTEVRPVLGISRLLLSTAKVLWVNFVLLRGCGCGRAGVYLTVHMVYYRWLSAMKLYEKMARLDRETIERKNNAAREMILLSLR